LPKDPHASGKTQVWEVGVSNAVVKPELVMQSNAKKGLEAC
jgi:hypothetical protein